MSLEIYLRETHAFVSGQIIEDERIQYLSVRSCGAFTTHGGDVFGQKSTVQWPLVLNMLPDGRNMD